jgi:hypothetical protein
MNIFVLDKVPSLAAQYHCDKHVVKMTLEYGQLLCGALHYHGVDDVPYKATHMNHPCSIWARETNHNYNWLLGLFYFTAHEYKQRYGKLHKTYSKLIHFADIHRRSIPSGPFTPFPLAMPDEYKTEDAVESYRNYYLGDKARFARWKTGNEPEWWTEKKVENFSK